MTYAGSAQLIPNASKERLAELSQRLENLNCEVSLTGKTLEFRLSSDENLWLTTGQLTLLFLAFGDVISQPEHGYRPHERDGRLQA